MDTYLPEIGVPDGVVLGRVPKEGYQRGWGLQFSDLAERVQREPLFQHASSAAGIGSLMSAEKRMNIYLLMTRFLPKLDQRHIVEFGSFRGGNALFMALVMQEIDPAARIFALDTYTGMPEADKVIDAHRFGDFADAALGAFQDQIVKLGLKNVLPVQGLFNETFPVLEPARRFGLAHIDADIYASVKYAQDAVWPRMTRGGYVVYDDAEVSSCLGATQALEELIIEKRIHCEQIWPHFVFRVGL
jgi:predicted O-methyltransferase YrrM